MLQETARKDHTGPPTTSSRLKIRWNLSISGNRLRTFTKEWKVDFLTIEDMAEAGFYYTGIQDITKCLYCPKEFQNWKKGDIPLDVHKRESPDCPFFKAEHGAYLHKYNMHDNTNQGLGLVAFV